MRKEVYFHAYFRHVYQGGYVSDVAQRQHNSRFFFIGESGVAGINAITPVTAIVTFFGDLVSTGVGIVFTREVGAMKKRRADEIYGQGLIISIGIGLLSALSIFLFQNVYFGMSGITGDILDKALQYYRFVPINAFLTIVIFYLEQMVYSDGDELCNNICYAFQIGGNIICSVILTKYLGMTGIILGSVIGNSLGILTGLGHFFTINEQILQSVVKMHKKSCSKHIE